MATNDAVCIRKTPRWADPERPCTVRLLLYLGGAILVLVFFLAITNPRASFYSNPVRVRRLTGIASRFMGVGSGRKDPITTAPVVCFLNASSFRRQPPMTYKYEDIPHKYCNFIVYSAVAMHPQTGELISYDPFFKTTVGYLTDLNNRNPKMRFIISIADEYYSQDTKSLGQLAKSESWRAKFVKKMTKWMRRHSVDGLNVQWSSKESTDSMMKLMHNLSVSFNDSKYLLTSVLPLSGIPGLVNLSQFQSYLDYMIVVSHDLENPSDQLTDVHSPLRSRPYDRESNNKLNFQDVIKKAIEQGVPKEKIIPTVSFHGQTYILWSQNVHDIRSPGFAGGFTGPYTHTPGKIAYFEFCRRIQRKGWCRKFDVVSACPYSFRGFDWIGYEDSQSVRCKAKYIRERRLGGLAVWDVSFDDYKGRCGRPNHLVRVIRDRLKYLRVRVSPKFNKTV